MWRIWCPYRNRLLLHQHPQLLVVARGIRHDLLLQVKIPPCSLSGCLCFHYGLTLGSTHLGTHIRDSLYDTLETMLAPADPTRSGQGYSLSQMGCVSSHCCSQLDPSIRLFGLPLTLTLRCLHVKQPLRVLRCLTPPVCSGADGLRRARTLPPW